MNIVRASLLTALGALVLTSCSPAPTEPVETLLEEFDLDTASGGGDGPVATGPALEPGRDYVVEIQGTYSIWGESGWQGGAACLGDPEPAPMYPSPGGQNVWVGLDAEFWFAIAPVSVLCSDFEDAMPNHTGRIELSLDGGASFAHVEPTGGEVPGDRPLGPDPEHRYRYEVIGGGHPLQVRRDGSTTYGVLKVRVYGFE